MGIITRFINRIRIRKSIRKDESTNVVDGMVRARLLYKRLSVLAHPDKNPDRREIAEDIMARITANRFNYAGLIQIEKEIEKKLK